MVATLVHAAAECMKSAFAVDHIAKAAQQARTGIAAEQTHIAGPLLRLSYLEEAKDGSRIETEVAVVVLGLGTQVAMLLEEGGLDDGLESGFGGEFGHDDASRGLRGDG